MRNCIKGCNIGKLRTTGLVNNQKNSTILPGSCQTPGVVPVFISECHFVKKDINRLKDSVPQKRPSAYTHTCKHIHAHMHRGEEGGVRKEKGRKGGKEARETDRDRQAD